MAFVVNATTVINSSRVLQNVTVDSTSTATQAEAEAGTNSTKIMTPERVSQAVAARTAALSAGAVGSYAFLGGTTVTTNLFGETRAGSGLYPAGVSNQDGWNLNGFSTGSVGSSGQASARAGTWRCMGVSRSSAAGIQNEPPGRIGATLWLRIS
jgi:hypothetical protein